MNTKFCTCAYYKCVDRGLKPVNHALNCPMFKQEDSPFKEEWIHKEDIKRYNQMNEKRKSHRNEQEIRNKKIGNES